MSTKQAKLSERLKPSGFGVDLKDPFSPGNFYTRSDAPEIIEAIRALEAQVETLRAENAVKTRGNKLLVEQHETAIRERDAARKDWQELADGFNRLDATLHDTEKQRDAALAKLEKVREWAERAAEDYGDEWERGYCDGGRVAIAFLDAPDSAESVVKMSHGIENLPHNTIAMPERDYSDE
jgi:hypothetical protein